jgi:hypothetical protein
VIKLERRIVTSSRQMYHKFLPNENANISYSLLTCTAFLYQIHCPLACAGEAEDQDESRSEPSLSLTLAGGVRRLLDECVEPPAQ